MKLFKVNGFLLFLLSMDVLKWQNRIFTAIFMTEHDGVCLKWPPKFCYFQNFSENVYNLEHFQNPLA